MRLRQTGIAAGVRAAYVCDVAVHRRALVSTRFQHRREGSVSAQSDAPRRYMSLRRRDIHSLRPWNQFAYPSAELRRAIEAMVRDAGLGQDSTVLDFGCADRPYRDVFGTEVRYVGADIPGNELADIDIAPDGTVPSPDASYDLIIS